MHEVILSVGIDIGTSTTQLIFSRLTIENRASSYTVPRIDIVNKEVIYRSKIYFTPLRSATEIDAEAVKRIVREEYQAAGMTPEMLRTGAVIITGETARKENANEVLEALSDLAGDFVVATAGPDLESVLSARGAGTDALSKEKRTAIANVDIGGGTSNIAVYEKGVLRGTCCLDIGGRLIKVENGRISYIFPKIHGLPPPTESRWRWRPGLSRAALRRVPPSWRPNWPGPAAWRGRTATTPAFIPQRQASAGAAGHRRGDLLRRRGGLHLSGDGGRRVSLRRHRRPPGKGHSGRPGSEPGGALYLHRDHPGHRGRGGNPYHRGQREHHPL